MSYFCKIGRPKEKRRTMAVIEHEEYFVDRAAMLAIRGLMKVSGTPKIGPEGRADYDAIMAHTPELETVRWVRGQCGGISGWWGYPSEAVPGRVLLYLHGGCYVLGSATAYRGLASQISSRSKTTIFVADYRLAPEHPFPAAFDDAVLALNGLKAAGFDSVAVVGDSAGGGLALALLAAGATHTRTVAAAVFSPWIDLALTGNTIQSRAEVDPILSHAALQLGARQYLRSADPQDQRANAISGDLSALPPVRIDVGDAEVLLADSLRIGAAIDASRGQCEVHVWKGMTHVFPSSVAMLKAAQEALDAVGAFLETAFHSSKPF
jgi:monoterpene epsilon-lactone hydrolase